MDVDVLSQHLGGDQYHPFVGAVEALGVGLGVLADNHAFRDLAIAVNDRLGDPAFATDVDLRQYDRIADLGEGIDPNLGEQQGTAHAAAGDDATAGDHGIDRHAAPVVVVEYELGGGILLLIGPDGPYLVIEIELRVDADEFHIGLPKGIHRAHVAPVGLLAGGRIPERVGDNLAVVDNGGNDVLAEITAGAFLVGIPDELLVQELGVEYVNAHGSKGGVGAARHRLRVGRFFVEFDDAMVFVHRHDAEFPGLIQGHFQATDGHVGPSLHVGGDHGPVVHLIDVIACQDYYVLGMLEADEIQVLVQGVGGAGIPGFGGALGSREELHELAEFTAQEPPALVHVANQGVGFVLRQDTNAADAGIDAIGKGEINDAEFSTEGNGRFRPPQRQVLKTRAAATCQDQGQGVAGNLADEPGRAYASFGNGFVFCSHGRVPILGF